MTAATEWKRLVTGEELDKSKFYLLAVPDDSGNAANADITAVWYSPRADWGAGGWVNLSNDEWIEYTPEGDLLGEPCYYAELFVPPDWYPLPDPEEDDDEDE